MAVFTYSFGPWVDDHGMTIQRAGGRDAESGATIVWLFHDRESDLYLYGYWASRLFAKVFVSEVRRQETLDPMWEASVESWTGWLNSRTSTSAAQSQGPSCAASS